MGQWQCQQLVETYPDIYEYDNAFVKSKSATGPGRDPEEIKDKPYGCSFTKTEGKSKITYNNPDKIDTSSVGVLCSKERPCVCAPGTVGKFISEESWLN